MRGRVKENEREEARTQAVQKAHYHLYCAFSLRVSETIADELFFYTSFGMLHKLKIGHLLQKAFTKSLL